MNPYDFFLFKRLINEDPEKENLSKSIYAI